MNSEAIMNIDYTSKFEMNAKCVKYPMNDDYFRFS